MALHSHFTIKPDAEITLEANPGTISLPVLSEYRRLGVNRLSIGIQSFDDEELKFLSRIHSSRESYQAFYDAREAGFSNVSIDLLYALPEQKMTSWRDTLGKSIALMPEHISAYNLTIEDETPLGKLVQAKIVSPLPDDEEAAFYIYTIEYLREKGYLHYEVSNYAKPGYESRHNLNYWKHAKYLGFGPSAHSFWGRKRWWNVSDIGEYIGCLHDEKLPIENSEELSPRQLLDEMIMLGLRRGFFDPDKAGNAVGVQMSDQTRSYIEELRQQKLITVENTGLRLTDQGFLYCDEIAKRLSFLY